MAGAEFDVTGDYETVGNNTYNTAGGSQTGALTFVNQGTLIKTGNGGTSIAVPQTNAVGGTITSNSGDLAIDDGGSFSGVINGTSEVDFAGGTSAINGSLTVTNVFNQTGGVIAVGQEDTLTLVTHAQFSPYGTGDIDGLGRLATPGATAIDENVYLGGGLTWDNSGVVKDGGDIYAGDTNGATATLTNLAGAEFDVTGDYETVGNNTYNTAGGSQTGALTFVNQGTLIKTGNGGTSSIAVALTNAVGGTITSRAG